jgi:hypothetical protein
MKWSRVIQALLELKTLSWGFAADNGLEFRVCVHWEVDPLWDEKLKIDEEQGNPARRWACEILACKLH